MGTAYVTAIYPLTAAAIMYGYLYGELGWLTILKDAFIRDELSKGRYDPALTKVCAEMMFEVFGRTLKVELGEGDGKELVVENVC